MQDKFLSSVLFRFITHNIRYDAKPPSAGEMPWSARLPLLSAHFQYHTQHIFNSIICLQEALHNQLQDILSSLNASCHGISEWAHAGVGRNDGATRGEYAPVLYRPGTIQLLSQRTRWLSPTPEVAGSKGWDAASVRICTEVHFRHHETGREFVVFNTHLDDQGNLARRHGARLILDWAQHWIFKGVPVLLAGDLNSEKDGEAYYILTQARNAFKDVEEALGRSNKYGDSWTFTGFDASNEEKQRLDYLFLGSVDFMGTTRSLWNPKGYAVLPNKFDNGIYHSDHRAVVGDIELM